MSSDEGGLVDTTPTDSAESSEEGEANDLQAELAARLGVENKPPQEDEDGWGSEEETKKKKKPKKKKKKQERTASKASRDPSATSHDPRNVGDDLFAPSDEEDPPAGGGGLFAGTGVKFDTEGESPQHDLEASMASTRSGDALPIT